MDAQPGSIVVEAEVTGAAGRAIAIGSLVPVQFVTESGISLPMVNGTVVARSLLPPASPPAPSAPAIRIEIMLRLSDLAADG